MRRPDASLAELVVGADPLVRRLVSLMEDVLAKTYDDLKLQVWVWGGLPLGSLPQLQIGYKSLDWVITTFTESVGDPSMRCIVYAVYIYIHIHIHIHTQYVYIQREREIYIYIYR